MVMRVFVAGGRGILMDGLATEGDPLVRGEGFEEELT
jgi:hypothetical protein